MGHIARLVWVKPPWADQIAAGKHTLVVGMDVKSGHIRVGTPLPYFISELLWVPREELVNVTEIPLDVVTLNPLKNSSETKSNNNSNCRATSTTRKLKNSSLDNASHTTKDLDDPLPNSASIPFVNIKESDEPLPDVNHPDCTKSSSAARSPLSDLPCSKRVRLSSMSSPVDYVSSVLSDSVPWILDIDLDFFSTGNPYRGIFSEEEYRVLQHLYQLREPSEGSDEGWSACCRERRRQLDNLERMWNLKATDDGDSRANPDQSIFDELKLTPADRIQVAEIKQKLWTYYNGSFVDPEYLHTAGIVSDLPVHISAKDEVDGLIKALSQLLEATPRRPALVTISRSCEDEYTPAHQVDQIQEDVLHVLGSSWQHCEASPPIQLSVVQDYLNTDNQDSPKTKQPAD